MAPNRLLAPVAFSDQFLPFSLMEAYSVQLIILSLRKNAGRSVTVRIVCYMRLASAIAARANCVRSVKKVFLPASHDGSVRFSGLCLHTRSFPLHLCSDRLSLFPNQLISFRVLRCCGEI